MISIYQSRLLAKKIRRLIDAEIANSWKTGVDPNYKTQIELELTEATNDLAQYIGRLRNPPVKKAKE